MAPFSQLVDSHIQLRVMVLIEEGTGEMQVKGRVLQKNSGN